MPTANPPSTSPTHPSAKSGTIVFLPVSSAVGTGEFMRCVLLADGIRRARADVRIVFGVSSEASVPDGFPYVIERLPASPTKSTPEVIALLTRERPQVVLWDNSGRAVQFKVARRLGARTVFLSVRPATRRKGFKLQRLLHTDELWLVDAMRPPTTRERALLRVFRRTQLQRFDALLTPPDDAAARARLASLGLAGATGEAAPFALLVATSFRDWFGTVAARAARYAALPIVCVGGEPDDAARASAPADRLHVLPLLPNGELMALIARATLVASGTGHIAEQVACFATPLVAIPVTNEQAQRARMLAERGVAVATRYDVEDAAETIVRLAGDAPAREALRAAAQARGLRNGLPDAVSRLLAAL